MDRVWILLQVLLLSMSKYQCSALEQRRDNDLVYALVFDAGSTGTRLHVYKCRYDSSHSTGIVLLDDKKKKLKPGLSAFKNSPSRAAQNIRLLLEFAKANVPKDMWATTGAAVRATAGMRLVDSAAKRKIATAVTEELQKSVFKYVPDTPYKILTGTEEAQFGWLTINALLNTFQNSNSLLGMLDMGGGSCQIAFTPNRVKAADRYVVKIETLGGEYTLHAHSYLGLGANSAKLKMLGYDASDPQAKNKVISSPCLNPQFKGTFKFGPIKVKVKGQQRDDPSNAWKTCYKLALNVIQNTAVHKQSTITEKKFVAVASFYYQALGAGLFSGSQKMATVTVKQFLEKGKIICENPGMEGTYEPYRCLDIMYIYAILRDGFGMNDNQNFKVADKLNGYDAGWAYGFAIHYLTTGRTIVKTTESTNATMCCNAVTKLYIYNINYFICVVLGLSIKSILVN